MFFVHKIVYGFRAQIVYGFRPQLCTDSVPGISKTEIREPKAEKNRVRKPYTLCVRIPYTGGQNASPLAFWQSVYGIRTQNVYGFRTRFLSAFGFRRLDREAFANAGVASAGRARGLDRTSLGRVLMGGSRDSIETFWGVQKMHYSGSQESSSGGLGMCNFKGFATSIWSVSGCLARHPFDGQNGTQSSYECGWALPNDTQRMHRDSVASVEKGWISSH